MENGKGRLCQRRSNRRRWRSDPYVGLCYLHPAAMLTLCWPKLPLSYPYLAAMLTLCWPKSTLCCPMLTLCWPQFPLSCPYVDPVFAYVGLGNALPHSTDRNGGGDDGVTTGWERGGNGVGTGLRRVGRRLGGHASITFGYHRRPPARTRAAARGPAPGFKG